MAQYKKTNNDDYINGLDENHKETLNKMLAIQDILLHNSPNDKRFIKNHTNYLIKYYQIIVNVQDKDYSDEYLQIQIKKLYDEIFKHRRY